MEATIKINCSFIHCILIYFILATVSTRTLSVSALIDAPVRHDLSVNVVHQPKNASIVQNKSGDVQSPLSAIKRGKGTPSVVPDVTSESPTRHNISAINEGIVVRNFPKINSGALLRGFYVFVGLSVIVVMYLVVRSVRLRRKVSRVHKYGVLASREDVEMTPLGAEDDDDDTIVFDLSSHPPP